MRAEEIIEQIYLIARGFESIHKVVLFGARARGDNHQHSDMDIAVFSVCLPFSGKGLFRDKIENIKTLLNMDVVYVDEGVDSLLLQNIETEGVVIYEKA